jgi:hypothetical protein
MTDDEMHSFLVAKYRRHGNALRALLVERFEQSLMDDPDAFAAMLENFFIPRLWDDDPELARALQDVISRYGKGKNGRE